MWKDIEQEVDILNGIMSKIVRDVKTVGEDQIFHGVIVTHEDQSELIVNLKAAKQLLDKTSQTLKSYLRAEISDR